MMPDRFLTRMREFGTWRCEQTRGRQNASACPGEPRHTCRFEHTSQYTTEIINLRPDIRSTRPRRRTIT